MFQFFFSQVLIKSSQTKCCFRVNHNQRGVFFSVILVPFQPADPVNHSRGGEGEWQLIELRVQKRRKQHMNGEEFNLLISRYPQKKNKVLIEEAAFSQYY